MNAQMPGDGQLLVGGVAASSPNCRNGDRNRSRIGAGRLEECARAYEKLFEELAA